MSPYGLSQSLGPREREDRCLGEVREWGGGVFLLQETRDDPRLSPAQDKQGLIC